MADSGNNKNQGGLPDPVAVCTCDEKNILAAAKEAKTKKQEEYKKKKEEVDTCSGVLSDCLIKNLENIGNDLSSFKLGGSTVDQKVGENIGINGCNGAVELIKDRVEQLNAYSEELSSEIESLDTEIQKYEDAIKNWKCPAHS